MGPLQFLRTLRSLCPSSLHCRWTELCAKRPVKFISEAEVRVWDHLACWMPSIQFPVLDIHYTHRWANAHYMLSAYLHTNTHFHTCTSGSCRLILKKKSYILKDMTGQTFILSFIMSLFFQSVSHYTLTHSEEASPSLWRSVKSPLCIMLVCTYHTYVPYQCVHTRFCTKSECWNTSK